MFGDSRVQMMIGSARGEVPHVTVTLAGLARPISETDLDEATPFALAEYPTICLRFRSPGGMRALRAAMVEAEERLAQMNIEAQRESLKNGRMIIDTGEGGERVSVDAQIEVSDNGVISVIPVADESATGIEKLQGGETN